MAFRGLSDVIQQRVQESLSAAQYPPGSPLSVQAGQAYVRPNQDDLVSYDVQRWGFSTWGVEPMIGAEYPSEG